MSEFTKGPWTVGDRVAYGWDIYQNNDVLTCIGVVHNGELLKDNATDKEAEANARLISAAPDMYEALRALSRGGCFCDCSTGNPMMGGKHSETCKNATAALSKADGTTNEPGA